MWFFLWKLMCLNFKVKIGVCNKFYHKCAAPIFFQRVDGSKMMTSFITIVFFLWKQLNRFRIQIKIFYIVNKIKENRFFEIKTNGLVFYLHFFYSSVKFFLISNEVRELLFIPNLSFFSVKLRKKNEHFSFINKIKSSHLFNVT